MPTDKNRAPLQFPSPTSPGQELLYSAAALMHHAGWDIVDMNDDGHRLTLIVTQPTPPDTQATVPLAQLDGSKLPPPPRRVS